MSLQKSLMTGQEITATEAKKTVKDMSQNFNDIMAAGGDYDDVEQMMLDQGMEMDDVMDLF